MFHSEFTLLLTCHERLAHVGELRRVLLLAHGAGHLGVLGLSIHACHVVEFERALVGAHAIERFLHRELALNVRHLGLFLPLFHQDCVTCTALPLSFHLRGGRAVRDSTGRAGVRTLQSCPLQLAFAWQLAAPAGWQVLSCEQALPLA
jgi:hypothetical protein